MRIVAVGGGTGLSTLLRGLKQEVGGWITELTAIVTVADSGGSTGKLRKIYNIPAPGDIRNCIVALSDSEEVMQRLFQYRFNLTALTDITGSFLEAVKLTSQILRTRGEIIPSTVEDVHLVAEFSDGETVVGEENITEYGRKGNVSLRRLWIEPEAAKAPIEAIAAVESADMIVFGPGFCGQCHESARRNRRLHSQRPPQRLSEFLRTRQDRCGGGEHQDASQRPAPEVSERRTGTRGSRRGQNSPSEDIRLRGGPHRRPEQLRQTRSPQAHRPHHEDRKG